MIMRGVARTIKYGRNASDGPFGRIVRPTLAISGAMFSLIGFALALAGYSLSGISALYLPAGLGLIVSGALLPRRHWAAAWTHMLVFAGTVTSLRKIMVGS